MKEVKVGNVYKHFKGFIIEVIAIAKHSETLEELVVYKRKEQNDYWARPISMFYEEVDHDKYPDVTQKYRFELISEGEE